MELVLSELGYGLHTHPPVGEDTTRYVHYECRFRVNAKRTVTEIAVPAAMFSNPWFDLRGYLQGALAVRVASWYDEPVITRWT